MRAFIAINLPDTTKSELHEITDRLKPVAPPARWVPTENLHITLKFLNEISDDQVTPLLGSIRMAVDEVRPFDLSLDGFKVFPNPHRARVFWIGINDGVTTLKSLAKAIDNEVHKLGFALEKRSFSAHLTLARLRQPGPVDGLLKAATEEHLSTKPIHVTQIDLVRSILSPTGAEHSTLGSVTLRQT